MPRLFVAAWPPDEILDRLAALPRPTVAGVRWTTREQWHVTLRFLGRVDDVGAVVSALATFSGLGLSGLGLSGLGLAPLEATLGPAVDRFAHRVLHVPVAGLEPVAVAVVAATASIGEPPEPRPFAGHITLARTGKGPRVDLRSLAGATVGGRWAVGEVCLVESRLGRAGARYEVLERFALGRGSPELGQAGGAIAPPGGAGSQ